ncbi:MAG: hypothetical protein CM15mP62_19050 [Rhodospirillaceae bacterium]|nr:MAG: hypothetical protein CM15mP62_19050 [Rhodospirillaceae bacterium]
MKDEDDKNIFRKFLQRADVLVENFRPGTMEKLGFGWETKKKDYPNVIMPLLQDLDIQDLICIGPHMIWLSRAWEVS